ncbi:MAG: hypothetical protein PF795_02805 [Kiritimatiellae bacterium]|jgi:hypothetical protein|nr:hypothetical protein [Kiritimatiellia bacterium]
MTTLPSETLPTEPVPPPLPEVTNNQVTNTTVLKSIGWLTLFLIVFFGVAILYALYLSVEHAFAEPGLAVENPELFREQIERRIENEMLSPGAIFRVGAG